MIEWQEGDTIVRKGCAIPLNIYMTQTMTKIALQKLGVYALDCDGNVLQGYAKYSVFVEMGLSRIRFIYGNYTLFSYFYVELSLWKHINTQNIIHVRL